MAWRVTFDAGRDLVVASSVKGASFWSNSKKVRKLGSFVLRRMSDVKVWSPT